MTGACSTRCESTGRSRSAEADPTARASTLSPRTAVVLGGLAIASWCWAVSGFSTFTRPAEAATGIPIAAVAIGILMSREGRPSRRVVRQPQRWLLAWAALLVLLVVWELYELRELPRYDHPTISSIVDSLFRRSRLVKAATIAGWLALGWRLVHPARHVEREPKA